MNFFLLKEKIEARQETLVKTYWDIFGGSIPNDKQYWTLCHNQPNKQGSEINQLVRLGLINKRQFHGVDKSKSIISQNKKIHPDAFWHWGEWIDVIKNNPKFNPALIYLDTMYVTTKGPALTITMQTLGVCPAHTMVAVNVMLTNPHSGESFDDQEFPKNIRELLTPEANKSWHEYKGFYIYSSTKRTFMGTYIFWRE